MKPNDKSFAFQSFKGSKQSLKGDASVFRKQSVNYGQPSDLQAYQKVNAPAPYIAAVSSVKAAVSKPHLADGPVLGFHDIANFGKYKWQSYYQIANIGDYKYLKWLLSGRIKLCPSCKPHVLSALLTEDTESQWTQEIQQDPENPQRRTYTWNTELQGSETKSPVVSQIMCSICQYFKSPEMIGPENVCKRCSKRPENNEQDAQNN